MLFLNLGHPNLFDNHYFYLLNVKITRNVKSYKRKDTWANQYHIHIYINNTDPSKNCFKDLIEQHNNIFLEHGKKTKRGFRCIFTVAFDYYIFLYFSLGKCYCPAVLGIRQS